MIDKIYSKIKLHRTDITFLLLLLTVAAVAHGWNMLHYPYFENDEATYVSQAYSTFHSGSLAPYTYWYDHAPGGWIFLGLWFVLTGGADIFGSLMNSGRIFMLILHLASCALLYLITNKLTKQRFAATIAVLIFSLSPLGIYFQRRILLDNIMIFWVLLALWLILNYKNRLRYVLLSALSFGIAILTKENAIFFIPAFVYILYARSHLRHRNHSILIWLTVTLSVVSLYFLYALLKNEFFPPDTFLGGTGAHVSLLKSLSEQSGRGQFTWPWEHSGAFYSNLLEWINRDPILIYGGAIATLAGIIISFRNQGIRIITLLGVLFWLFLARGKLVIDFYVVPIIPLLAILIGACLAMLTKKVDTVVLRKVVPFLIVVILLLGYAGLSHKQYFADETSNQLSAVKWITKNVPSNSYIAMDDYAYPYLREEKYDYPNADWVWKLQLDPAVRAKVKNDWQNIQYVLLTHEVLKQIHSGAFPFIKNALDHSDLMVDFSANSTSYRDIKNYVSTNGDWAQVYKVKSKAEIVLQDSWQSYKSTFLKSYGQVVDGNKTTSEGQAYALIRAIGQKDQNTFDGTLAWTRDHMQHRQSDSLFSWKWENINGVWMQTDANTATDADQDIAYSLIKASELWHKPEYQKLASTIVGDIWRNEVVSINGHYYLASSAAGEMTDGSVLVNPSYIAPSYYKEFAKIDPTHQWNALTNDSYDYLRKAQNSTTGLFPDWTRVDAVGNLIPVADPTLSTNSGYDAFRTSARLIQDKSDIRAQALLTPIASFYNSEWLKNKMIYAVYATDGKPLTNYGDIAQYSTAANLLSNTNYTKQANNIYTSKVSNNYKNGYWGDKMNYYNQNWAAFSLDFFESGISAQSKKDIFK